MRLWKLLLPDDLYILPQKDTKVNTFFEIFSLFFAQFFANFKPFFGHFVMEGELNEIHDIWSYPRSVMIYPYSRIYFLQQINAHFLFMLKQLTFENFVI